MYSVSMVRSRFIFPCLLVLFVLLGFDCESVRAVQSEPIDQVRKTVEKVLSIITDESMAGPEMEAERDQKVFEVVGSRFDFREMSQRALATHWKRISGEEQDVFVNLFSRLLQNTYLKKINAYSDEGVLYKGQEIRKNKAVVETIVVKNNVEIPLIYRLKKKADQWLVYDVVIEGVSLVRNYRSQFKSIISREKYSGLLKRMEKKIEQSEEKAE